ncbi:MAG: zinc ABC transporter substrate-binding protein [Fibrobacter sp.]|nr:zinc ABC transporter substrate-binding protein [Fibrobacter sp.]
MNKFACILCGLLFAAIIGCNKPVTNSDKPVVFVSIQPQKYFVEKIVKDLAQIEVLVPAGSSPHTYEPKPSQMSHLSKASLYFAIGIELENAWLEKIKKINPNLKIIHTDKNVNKIISQNTDIIHDKNSTNSDHDHHEHANHDHDETADLHHDHHEHSHSGPDPHIWLSPELVKKQAAIIAETFIQYDSTWKDTIVKNNESFLQELSQLQDSIRQILSGCESQKPFLVFHPSWNYFAKEFNLLEVPIELDGKEPSPKELGSILNFAKKLNINTIFVQPGFSDKSAQIIAKELNGTVSIADPLDSNWSQNLLNMAKALKKDD